jgi:predicted nucleic acid-binding protein
MPVNYRVEAEIIDIASDTPLHDDIFLVDTNIWYWLTYPNATAHVASKMIDYPEYLNKALTVGSKIYHSTLSLAELSHIIEKTEKDIYCRTVCNIKTKEYRHNLSGQRGQVVAEIESAWSQVTNLAEPLSVDIDKDCTLACIDRLKNEKVDGYDLFILESMKSKGIINIITDDGDFATIPGIKVFTLNRGILSAGRTQKRLQKR